MKTGVKHGRHDTDFYWQWLLIALLEHCHEKIELNPEKLHLRKQEVPYIGH